MDMQIAGERALILGGTKGLAYSCAKFLTAEGVAVALVGRDTDVGNAAATALGDGASFIQTDLADKFARKDLAARATQELDGAPSILVTNAGGPPTGEFLEQDSELWRTAFELNVLAHVEMTQAVLPAMLDAGFGRIINITSFTAKEPYPNMALSNSLRVGLHGAMSTLAREVAGRGVTVNNLLPGLMDTGALQRVISARMEKDNKSEDEVRASMSSSIPANRLGLADDFGPACAFLCSRYANYITAQNLAVDGGLIRALI
jgi:3-oxoacyl-[acyl-carrier protein] reductase